MKNILIPMAIALTSIAITVRAEPFEITPGAAAKDTDYTAGKAAMDKKNWPEAAKRFQMALQRDPNSADLHNYLGFSYRNLKQMGLSFKHYKRSIEIEPRHRGAHEYIGEAYLMMNDLPNAEKHLAALRKICPQSCEELADLEKAVKEYRAKKQ
jgi:tetratricopeptide (TPR) repeat protein